MAKLDDLNPAARRGYALALGSLAPRVLGAEEMDQEEPEQELVIDEKSFMLHVTSPNAGGQCGWPRPTGGADATDVAPNVTRRQSECWW